MNYIDSVNDMKINSDALFMLVSTRFGVGVTDQDWLKHRLVLFEAITAPSLRNQKNQNFTWCIFIGAEASAWVVDELKRITNGIGNLVELICTPQDLNHFRKLATDSGKAHAIIAMIDDDDAWLKNMTQQISNDACRYIENGSEKCIYTYSNGIEWLITDLADIDALQTKNQKIIRKQAAYPYERPFLTMSTFVLAPAREIPNGIFRAHSSFGKAVIDEGFESFENNNSTPAWLYVRHRQADSSIRKAHNVAPANYSIEEFSELFGIDERLVRNYQTNSDNYGYSIKRVRKGADRGNMVFKLEDENIFSKEGQPKTQSAILVSPEGLRIDISKDLKIDAEVRIVIYDNSSKMFLNKDIVSTGHTYFLPREKLPTPLNAKLKVQKENDLGVWVDYLDYKALKELISDKNS